MHLSSHRQKAEQNQIELIKATEFDGSREAIPNENVCKVVIFWEMALLESALN